MSDSDSEGDYAGPALPPALAAKQKEKNTTISPVAPPSITQAATSTSSASIGPRLPERVDDGDSDDEEIGPAPLPEHLRIDADKEGIQEFIEQEESRRIAREEASRPQKQERDEWMLVPPKNMGMLGPGDTTKIKARGFKQGTSSSNIGNSSGPNLWTETPAERAKRLDDEIMGKRAPASKDDGDAIESAEHERKRKRDKENSKAIEEYNKVHRSESLLESHQRRKEEENREKKKKKKDKEKKDKKSKSDKKKDKKSYKSDDDEDDRPPPIWDHQRDMAMGGGGRLMSEKQRAGFINEAKGLASRFTSGKSR